MDVAQLLKKLAGVADVEVIVAMLPEVVGVANQTARDSLLERLKGHGQRLAERFTHQQMHMFRHDNIAIDAQRVASTHPLQSCFKDRARLSGAELVMPPVTAESTKVALPGLVKAPESPRHRFSLAASRSNCKDYSNGNSPHPTKNALDGPPASGPPDAAPIRPPMNVVGAAVVADTVTTVVVVVCCAGSYCPSGRRVRLPSIRDINQQPCRYDIHHCQNQRLDRDTPNITGIIQSRA